MPDPVSWLRLYHSILDNRKTANLSPDKFGHLIRLLLLASRNTPRGRLPELKIIKRHLGATTLYKNPTRLKSLLEYFINLGLIDQHLDSSLWIHNFSSRQWLNSTEVPTEVPTDSGHKLLQGFIEDNRFMSENYTESAGTEAETDIYRGLKKLFDDIKYIISVIRIQGERLAGSKVGGNSALIPGKSVSPKDAALFSLSAQSKDRRNGVFESISALWNNSPGVIHHKAFNIDDHKAITRALEQFSLDQIKLAIERYSAWSVGAASGQYREAYRWSFYEFITRHHGGLIKRLISDGWEDTCRPFNNKRSSAPVTVSDLLALAEKRRKG